MKKDRLVIIHDADEEVFQDITKEYMDEVKKSHPQVRPSWFDVEDEFELDKVMYRVIEKNEDLNEHITYVEIVE